MRSRQEPLKLLLDTSFILPTLGVEVSKGVSVTLKRLSETEAQIHYSQFSLLESLWVATRLLRSSFNFDRFSSGLRSLLEGRRYTKVVENSEIFGEALRLFVLGHRDMIDNILYSDSTRFALRLLTIDRSLTEFIETNNLERTLIYPDEIA